MTKLVLRTGGRRYEATITTTKTGKRLICKSSFLLSKEFKAMRGSNFDWDNKWWTIENHPRNHFQLRAMMMERDGENMEKDNPYAWFERDVEAIDDIQRPLMPHQIDMIQKALTYRYQLFAADMGLGKTLIAFEIIERMFGGNPDPDDCWFVGPRSALESVDVDMLKWDGPADMRSMTYERLTSEHASRLDNPPRCLILDECTNVKHSTNLRSRAAQAMADAIRAKHGNEGMVILMSGSPTAKRPSDIWSQAEVCYPGFLREGSLKAFENRYAIQELGEDSDGNQFNKITGWHEDQVAKIPARLDGLMSVYRVEDILKLPPQTFHVRTCKVTPRIKRVAKALVSAAPNVISGLTALRALSSGFQYKDGEPGLNGERPKVNAPCPKDDILREILAEESLRGRMIVGASFQGSIDRVKGICQEEGWDTVTVDGRGWNSFDHENNKIKMHILEAWANNVGPTVLIGNPASCRYGLTLNEAKTIVVYDQNFSAEHRRQFLRRNWRIGQDEPVRVIDLIHLPVDQLILDTLIANGRMESLSLGLILESLEGIECEV